MGSKSVDTSTNDDGTPSPGMVTRLFDRVRTIKQSHPDLSRKIDSFEADIRDRMMAIKDTVDEFPSRERELITVLVINGIHKMCDEILIDDPEDNQPDG